MGSHRDDRSCCQISMSPQKKFDLFFARGSSNATVIVDHSLASSFRSIGDGFLMRMEEPGAVGAGSVQ